MAAVGTISAFRPDSEKIDSYLDVLSCTSWPNTFPDERRVPVLLSVISATTYEILRSLLAPDLPQTKTYGELVEKLKTHYSPKPMVIAECFHFHRRAQKLGESVADYLAELRRLSLPCEFGTYLQEAADKNAKTLKGSETAIHAVQGQSWKGSPTGKPSKGPLCFR